MILILTCFLAANSPSSTSEPDPAHGQLLTPKQIWEDRERQAQTFERRHILPFVEELKKMNERLAVIKNSPKTTKNTERIQMQIEELEKKIKAENIKIEWLKAFREFNDAYFKNDEKLATSTSNKIFELDEDYKKITGKYVITAEEEAALDKLEKDKKKVSPR